MVRVRADCPIFTAISTQWGASRFMKRRMASMRSKSERIILRCPIAGCPCVASLPGEQEEA